MSSKSRVNSDKVKCPFWRGYYESTTIRCEGFVEGSEVRVQFETRQGRYSYEKAFCRRGYWLCPLARACEEEKYGDED